MKGMVTGGCSCVVYAYVPMGLDVHVWAGHAECRFANKNLCFSFFFFLIFFLKIFLLCFIFSWTVKEREKERVLGRRGRGESAEKGAPAAVLTMGPTLPPPEENLVPHDSDFVGSPIQRIHCCITKKVNINH